MFAGRRRATKCICAAYPSKFLRAAPPFQAGRSRRFFQQRSSASGGTRCVETRSKFTLERELLWRGLEVKVSVLATQLEIRDGRWTGRVAGAAMFGEEKALAIKRFARERGIPLAQSSAYGDSSLDRWMLASVGHPVAINPTRRLRRVARLHGWQILAWTHESLAKHQAVAKRGSITEGESERTAGGHRDLKRAPRWSA